MAGFVCIDSSLSKVVGNTDKELSNDSAVRASLSHARVGEVPLELSPERIVHLRHSGFPEIDANLKSFKSRRGTAASREFRLVHQPSGKYRVQIARDKVFRDVVVMGYYSDDGQAVVPVTADYDIFAICTHHTAPGFSTGSVTVVENSAGEGMQSGLQRTVRDAINQRCGGHPVVNHSTELNNPFPERDPELVMFTPAGPARIIYRDRLSSIFGDLILRGFHVYSNAFWPEGIKATTRSKINQLNQPSRVGAVTLAALNNGDFAGLAIKNYKANAGEERALPSVARRFAAEVLNNRASAPGLPASSKRPWRP